ncbi:MAG: GNAT family N-acetyltransferase [Steroidobacteraceae bacterium]
MPGAPPSTGVDVVIERLKEEDLGELLTLQRAAFLLDAQLYGNPFLPSLTQTLEQLRAEAADPNRVFLAAKRGARLVGSVRALRQGRIIHISRLMTAPDVTGGGIGGSLLSAIEAAMEENAYFFELCTGTKSTVNIGMYQRRGYRIVNETIDEAGVNIVNMSKPVVVAAR